MSRQSLGIAVFTNADPGVPVRWVSNFANLGVRCSLPGWLQRLEWTERKASSYQAFAALTDDLGRRVALIDSMMNVIVDGWIYEAEKDGLQVNYVASGAWRRHEDQLDTTTYTATDSIDTVVQTILTDHVPAVSSDQTQVVGSGTAVNLGFETRPVTGSTPAELIEELITHSDSSFNIYDYWIQSIIRLTGSSLELPRAFLKTRGVGSTVEYELHRSDLRDDPRTSRALWDLATRTTVYYHQRTRINNVGGYAKGTTVMTVDSGAIFADGDEATIFLDGGQRHRTVISGVSGNSITINDALPDTVSDNAYVWNDTYTATSTYTDTAAEASYWRVDHNLKAEEMGGTAADDWANQYSAKYAAPQQDTAITVGAPFITAGQLYKAPLWNMLRSPFFFRIADLDPVHTLSLDNQRTFFSTAVDYNGRTMRVVPDNEDRRLDAILKRAGIEVGELVHRG